VIFNSPETVYLPGTAGGLTATFGEGISRTGKEHKERERGRGKGKEGEKWIGCILSPTSSPAHKTMQSEFVIQSAAVLEIFIWGYSSGGLGLMGEAP